MSSHRGMVPRPSLPSFLSGLGRPRARRGSSRAEPRPVIKLKSPREIALMREAGRVVAKALDRGPPDGRAGRDHRRHGRRRRRRSSASTTRLPCSWAIPARSRGSRRSRRSSAPASTSRSCTASPTAGPLREGDIVSIDTGCKVDGWCGDSAVTLAIGAGRPRGPEAARRDLRDRSTWPSAPWPAAAPGRRSPA